jgi:hypothetical protein
LLGKFLILEFKSVLSPDKCELFKVAVFGRFLVLGFKSSFKAR